MNEVKAMAEKIKYIINDGVEWMNGKKVRGQKTIDLTETEALFDLAQGRITPADTAPAKPRKK